MLRAADVRNATFRVVADQPRPVVRVGKVFGDQPMEGGDEIDRERPRRIERGLPRPRVSRLDVEHSPLLDLLHLSRVEIHRRAGLVLGEGAAFDRVGPVDAAGDDFAFQLVGDLRQGGVCKPRMGILDTLHRQPDL